MNQLKSIQHLIHILLVLLLVLAGKFQSYGQGQYALKGKVVDSESGESIVGAHISLNSQVVIQTDIDGLFTIYLPSGSHQLTVSYAGKTTGYDINLTSNTEMELTFDPSIEIANIEIVGHRDRIIHPDVAGLNSIPMATLRQVPQLMGERDVIRAMQLLPGVTSAGEGNAGLVVRGGSTNQNLFLLDGAEIYNPNHVLGFFSIFNDDAIGSADLYKGYMPARFNGRLSSVLDISLKEGSRQKTSTMGSIGIMSSKAQVETPILNDKGSLVASVRGSYLDLFIKPFMQKFTQYDNASYNFYDFTAKATYRISPKDQLNTSFYKGFDIGESGNELRQGDAEDGFFAFNTNEEDWGNTAAVLRWRHLFNNILSSDFRIDHSSYYYNNRRFSQQESYSPGNPDEIQTNTYLAQSNIYQYGVSYDLRYSPGATGELNAGVKYNRISMSPKASSYVGISDETIQARPDQVINDELTVYAEGDLQLFDQIDFTFGLNVTQILAESNYYLNLLPRVNAEVPLHDKITMMASYTRASQNVNIVSQNAVGLASDLWIPLTSQIKPSTSEQIAIGGTWELPLELGLSLDGFYKRFDRLLAFKEGTVYNHDSISWRDQLTTGKGHAYGIEFMLEKSSGRFRGWLAYTWSRSFRTFDQLNDGKEFPYKYDRPHDFKVFLSWKFSERFDIGSTWVYTSGRRETIGTSRYVPYFWVDFPESRGNRGEIGSDIIDYRYNAFQLPAYHRMDIVANYHFKPRRFESTVSIGIYNVYHRQNPYSISWTGIYSQSIHNKDSYYILDYVNLFGILPFVNYSFRF